jgi:hypothetical protein
MPLYTGHLRIWKCILIERNGNRSKNSAKLELMFGLVELGFRFLLYFICFLFWVGGSVTLYFFFIFYLVRLWLGFIPKISFLACLVVPKKFVWVVLVVGGLE